MEKSFPNHEIAEQENYEAQPLTDPDVQEDFVLIRGEHGEMHRIETVTEEVDDDVDSSDD